MIDLDSRKDKPVSTADFIEIVQEQTNGVGIPLNYDRMLDYIVHYSLRGTRTLQKLGAKYGFEPTSKDFHRYICNLGLTDGFTSTTGGNISFSADSVKSFIDTAYYGKDHNIYEIVKQGSEAITGFKWVAQLKTTIEEFIPKKNWNPNFRKTNGGNRCLFAHPIWTEQNTGRIGDTEPALMNISSMMRDIYAEPEGYTSIVSDSSQIEPLIVQYLYLKIKELLVLTRRYGDAYFAYAHYALCELTELLNSFETVELMDTQSEQAKDGRKRIKTLGNATVYGSSSGKDDKDSIEGRMIARIGNHPNLVKVRKDADIQIHNDNFIFRTLFGSKVDCRTGGVEDLVISGDLQPYTPKWYEKCKKAGVNGRIQGTAADLLKFASIKTVNDIITAGRGSAFFAGTHHDSIRPYVKTELVDTLGMQLAGNTSYMIDGQLKIKNEVKVGITFNTQVPRYYSKPEKEGYTVDVSDLR